MKSLTEFVIGRKNLTKEVVTSTAVIWDGDMIMADILIPKHTIDRVTKKALDGIDDYEPSDSKQEAIEHWLGTFATEEIWQERLGMRSWSTNHASLVKDVPRISELRVFPFLECNTRIRTPVFKPVYPTNNPELYAAELAFTERAMQFLLEKEIIV